MLLSDTLGNVLSRAMLYLRALWPAVICLMVSHHFIYKNTIKNYVTGLGEIKTFYFLSPYFPISESFSPNEGGRNVLAGFSAH